MTTSLYIYFFSLFSWLHVESENFEKGCLRELLAWYSLTHQGLQYNVVQCASLFQNVKR